MASSSYRDRLSSPSVGRALTSPGAILAAGAGAALGIVATAPVSVPLAVVGALAGGIAGFGARVALAVPRAGRGERIDPFAVQEPWRHAVRDALQAQRRFDEAVRSFRAGPLRDTLTSVGAQLDEAVAECWRVAKQGQLLADARGRIDDREIDWELGRARAGIGPGGPSETQQRTIDALEAQLATAARMDGLVRTTREELDLLNARLDESVTRAIELSVSNQVGGVGSLGSVVGEIVQDLEALHAAMADLDGTAPPPPAAPGPRPTVDPAPSSADPDRGTTAATLPPPPPPPPPGGRRGQGDDRPGP